jgi:hypothetical protein
MIKTLSRLIILLFPGLLITGCAHPVTVIGQVGPDVDIDRVNIYYPDRPKCNFDTIAHIRIEGGYYRLSSLIEKMRSQAASVGADAVYITQTDRLDIKEYTGVAKAIRCETT